MYSETVVFSDLEAKHYKSFLNYVNNRTKINGLCFYAALYSYTVPLLAQKLPRLLLSSPSRVSQRSPYSNEIYCGEHRVQANFHLNIYSRRIDVQPVWSWWSPIVSDRGMLITYIGGYQENKILGAHQNRSCSENYRG
jgi:hypothetical protein